MSRIARLVIVSVPALVLLGFIASRGTPQAEPKPPESRVPVVTADVAESIHIAVFWDAKAQAPSKMIGARKVKSEEEFTELMGTAMKDWQKVKKPDVVVLIDAAGEVPWKNLVEIVSTCRKAGAKRIELLAP
jgi:biopolymer transport protein ExbD